MKIGEIQEQLKDSLHAMPEIQLVYVFGSQVDGHIGPMSDIDMGVLLDSDEVPLDSQLRLRNLFINLLHNEKVDIVLLNQVPVELAYHVIASGKILYERNIAARVEYEAYVLGRYGDYLPVLRSLREQILQGDEYESRVQRYRTSFGRTERSLGKAAAAVREKSD